MPKRRRHGTKSRSSTPPPGDNVIGIILLDIEAFEAAQNGVSWRKAFTRMAIFAATQLFWWFVCMPLFLGKCVAFNWAICWPFFLTTLAFSSLEGFGFVLLSSIDGAREFESIRNCLHYLRQSSLLDMAFAAVYAFLATIMHGWNIWPVTVKC